MRRLSPRASAESGGCVSLQWRILSGAWMPLGICRCPRISIALIGRWIASDIRPCMRGSGGSAAAPTAGLHFTPKVLEQIQAAGVDICTITLHVGLGTFQPVRVADTAAIRLHSEHYELSEQCAERINAARERGGRVVAAGTTTVRTLEHCASLTQGGRLEPHSGATDIFISPGFRFRAVDALLTNFHLPQSTLLMLVAAFAGRDNVLAAYRHAVGTGYRFFSYGDCMFIS